MSKHRMSKHRPSPSGFIDSSLWAVIFGNILSIGLAYAQGWDMGEIMWIYWGQSVIIGILNVVRILSLKEFTTKGMTQNGRPVPETQKAKREIAIFFSIHYGFFHFLYALFLWKDLPLNTLAENDLALLMLCVIGFFFAHQYSLRYNAHNDFKQKKPNLGTLMFYPYLRIIPMHLTIIFGSTLSSAGTLLIFMVLKTFADAGMHMIEHHLFRKADKSEMTMRD